MTKGGGSQREPPGIALSIPLAVAYQFAGGVFPFLYYNRAAHGLPWYFADSLHTPGVRANQFPVARLSKGP